MTKGLFPVLLLLAVAVPAAAPAPARQLRLHDIKIEWSGGGEEELPTWLSATWAVAADGSVSGSVVEVGLNADGTDEDGDPAGFETYVFSTQDQSLKDAHFDGSAFSFRGLYPGQPAYELKVAGHVDADGGTWAVSARSSGEGRVSDGHNRFTVDSQLKDGCLELYADPDQGSDNSSQAI